MYENLALFQTAAAKARHAGSAQTAVARNIANADTPGYRAKHAVSFDASLGTRSKMNMQMTRPSHLQAASRQMDIAFVDAQVEASPNGNTVSIEEEMLMATQISSDHNQALAVYRHTMTVLRTALGR